MSTLARADEPQAWQALQRVAAMVGICTPRWTQVFVLLLYGLLSGVGVLVLHIAKRPERGAIAALALVAIATACLWGMWLSRIVLLRMDARLSRMPTMARDARKAMALAFAMTVLLPAAVLAGLGADFGFAVATLAAAAMAGLVGAMLPAAVYLALCFAPLVLAMADSVGARVFGTDVLPGGLQFSTTQMPWLAVLLALLACWRWRAVVRGAGLPAQSPWRRPMVTAPLGSGLGLGGLFGGDMNQWHAHLPDWVWPAGQIEREGPARPVKALRCLLGTPFAPLSRGQILTQLGFGVLAVGYFLLQQPGGSSGARIGLIGGMAAGGSVLLYLFGARLELLRQCRSGELVELALLPGWGDAERARRTLLRAVAWTPSLAYVAALLLSLGVAIGAGLGGADAGLLLLALLGMGLLGALGCLRPLAGQRMSKGWILLLFAPGFLLPIATMIVVVFAIPGAAFWLGLAWLLLYAAIGANLLRSWRRFNAQPHPFVQP